MQNETNTLAWIGWRDSSRIQSQCAPCSESKTSVIPETQNSLESSFLRKHLSTPELTSGQPSMPKRPGKHLGDDSTHNLILLQNRLSENLKCLKWHS